MSKIVSYSTIEELLTDVEGDIILCESEEAALADIQSDNAALEKELDNAKGV